MAAAVKFACDHRIFKAHPDVFTTRIRSGVAPDNPTSIGDVGGDERVVEHGVEGILDLLW
jgi:hypothetical protein